MFFSCFFSANNWRMPFAETMPRTFEFSSTRISWMLFEDIKFAAFAIVSFGAIETNLSVISWLSRVFVGEFFSGPNEPELAPFKDLEARYFSFGKSKNLDI